TGFIGREVVTQAVDRGFHVNALARSDDAQASLRARGANPIAGDAENPLSWREHLSGADALVDLLQPKFPKRLRRTAVAAMSERRQRFTAGLLEAIAMLPEAERPLLLSVSGAEDLQPDERGNIAAGSPLCSEPVAFS